MKARNIVVSVFTAFVFVVLISGCASVPKDPNDLPNWNKNWVVKDDESPDLQSAYLVGKFYDAERSRYPFGFSFRDVNIKDVVKADWVVLLNKVESESYFMIKIKPGTYRTGFYILSFDGMGFWRQAKAFYLPDVEERAKNFVLEAGKVYYAGEITTETLSFDKEYKAFFRSKFPLFAEVPIAQAYNRKD